MFQFKTFILLSLFVGSLSYSDSSKMNVNDHISRVHKDIEIRHLKGYVEQLKVPEIRQNYNTDNNEIDANTYGVETVDEQPAILNNPHYWDHRKQYETYDDIVEEEVAIINSERDYRIKYQEEYLNSVVNSLQEKGYEVTIERVPQSVVGQKESNDKNGDLNNSKGFLSQIFSKIKNWFH